MTYRLLENGSSTTIKQEHIGFLFLALSPDEVCRSLSGWKLSTKEPLLQKNCTHTRLETSAVWSIQSVTVAESFVPNTRGAVVWLTCSVFGRATAADVTVVAHWFEWCRGRWWRRVIQRAAAQVRLDEGDKRSVSFSWCELYTWRGRVRNMHL